MLQTGSGMESNITPSFDLPNKVGNSLKSIKLANLGEEFWCTVGRVKKMKERSNSFGIFRFATEGYMKRKK